MPLVSVIISSYNSNDFIGQTIESFLNQTFADFELIIVDDGSTDATVQTALGYSQKDQRVRVLTSNHQGSSHAKNLALKECKGDYIAVSDADDISYPKRLELQKDHLDQHQKTGLVGSHFHFINEHGDVYYSHDVKKILGGNVSSASLKKELYLRKNHFLHSSIMFRKELLEKVNGYDENLNAALDYDFILRLSEYTQVDILPEMLAAWRRHGNQITYQRDILQQKNSFLSLRRHLKKLLKKVQPLDEQIELNKFLTYLSRDEINFQESLDNGKFHKQKLYNEAHNTFYADKDYDRAHKLYREYLLKFSVSLNTLKACVYVLLCTLKARKLNHA